jgi:threonine aldolase
MLAAVTAVIDLRSDTVTRPSAAMREAMARAEVGDDVYGEDPSVIALQERASALTGCESALFVPSGTMANQLAIRAHSEPGDALIATPGAHIFAFEGGAIAALSGVQPTLLGSEGAIDPDALGELLEATHRPHDAHYARLRLVCFENTHNRAGGRVVPLETQRAVARVARAAGLRMHLDGARIFNASIATGLSVRELCAPYDTVCFCLSKGLGAPVGSLVCGPAPLIARAHRFRKMFGGGMRQAGVLAAAALYALDHHVKDLALDHQRAARLAQGLGELGYVHQLRAPETNIVLFEVGDAPRFVRLAREAGVLLGAVAGGWVRAVTHRDVDGADIERALGALRGLALD